MNTDKAYLLGLAVGGGCFSADNRSFYIRLPYKQWGEAAQNPTRAGMIAGDILRVVKPLMAVEYGLEVSYTTGKEWRIVCHGDPAALIADLRSFQIEPTSCLHKTADLQFLIAALVDTNLKKRFIAGVADTIGSMAPSHRRFTDDVQIISFEISGFNYRYVCQLCELLYQLGCVPDQILWQHPNMQSGADAYYPSWRKGNKLRVTLDSFSTFGSLAFRSKAVASRENRQLEGADRYNAAEPCEQKKLAVSGVVAVHKDENCPDIPAELRGGHFIHHKQICAALHCPHAPTGELDRLLRCAEHYVSPFTVLHKGTAEEIDALVQADPLLRQRTYTTAVLRLQDLIDAAEHNYAALLFAHGAPVFFASREKGYPVSTLLTAASYIIANRTGQLKGKRPLGNRSTILAQALAFDPDFSILVQVPDLLTPLLLTDHVVSAMVGPYHAAVYRSLISYAPENPYKMLLRPITEEDLR